MRIRFAINLLLAGVCILTSCSPAPRTFELNGSYGTLVYKGTVERVSNGSNYVYTVKNLVLTYSPFAQINMTDEIKVNVEFVATTRPPSGEGPWKRIFVQTHQTSDVLHTSAPTLTIKEVSFTVPKDVVDKADSVGLTVTDGKILWPFAEELK